MIDRNDPSLLPIGMDESAPPELSTAMQECALALYRQAWKEYRDVGCPYGETDDAMLVWFSLRGEPAPVTSRN